MRPKVTRGKKLRYGIAALLAACLAPCAGAQEDAAAYVRLDVYPPQVTLHWRGQTQRLVAVATRADGVTQDVTDEVAWGSDAEGVQVEGGLVRAAGAGAARVRAELGGLSAELDLQAASDNAAPPTSFCCDVMPVLTRAGCNSGGCHGSSRGKDGFRMSLFGFDPAGDHFRLTREEATRRVNLALPEESLVLKKATGAVPHTGGKLFDQDSQYYQALRDWIAGGAANDVADALAVESVELFPPRIVLEGAGAEQRLVAVAHYSDGTSRDVTPLAVFQSNNEGSAAIAPSGVVTSVRRGEAFVMARFDTHTVGSQTLVLPAGDPFEPSADPPANYIDRLVTDKLDTLRVRPSGVADDETFLRRVTVDLVGRLPTPEEREAFLADESPQKRSDKIDALVEAPAFADLWAHRWAELLLVRTENNRVDYKPMFLYHQWLKEQIDSGRPLDEMIHDLLAASGSSFENPAVNFYQVDPDPKKIAENVAQSLLGIRVQCAQCHNHPFDRWTMDDYYGFTAYFSQIGRKTTDDYREWVVYNRGSGDATNPVTGKKLDPKPLGGDAAEVGKRDRRSVVADWVTSPENPYFATSVANRVWASLFGVGIVEPVDDVRVSNPPSNPELFEALGAKLVEYDFDTRQLVRDICNSHTYQRSGETNASNAEDLRNFSHAVPRRMGAEVLLDCVCQVTESPEKLPGLPLGAHAVQVADGRAGNYFLTTFGRSKRETVCACESRSDPTLSQALHLLNGGSVHGKAYGSKLAPDLWAAQGNDPAKVIDAFYVRCLTRLPTEAERAKLTALVADSNDKVGALRDVLWALLNSREFLFNH
ncbi:hypothetical protein Pla175_49250 [Pirellulimonas nuda]|uniref:Bacterial Ig-like domain (Group 2) n=1 Tax=Pirellulimonas nuda TaxID=2528009 RepID=A0A518DJ73_9BACT|nr:DUF1549 and DUF1553 domain-containing protein [Pirellulimonas nuda]QDU91496.1 hypothetical protein Pla175_49250 [Pirellulimonas nuda]